MQQANHPMLCDRQAEIGANCNSDVSCAWPYRSSRVSEVLPRCLGRHITAAHQTPDQLVDEHYATDTRRRFIANPESSSDCNAHWL